MPHYIDPEEFVNANSILLDVRTPAEFESGHIPGAINLPLFTNEERAVVGTLYKQQGKDPAVEQGLAYVGPRMAGWVKYVRELAKGRPIHIHCWRGGMRSSSMAWLFETAGIQCSVLRGGYKAYRHSFGTLLQQHTWKMVVVAGPTGCGKTAILDQLVLQGEQVLPLETLANHKGSAFGALGQENQPTNEQFENDLHHYFCSFDPTRVVWAEGESKTIGRNFIPQLLFEQLQKALTVELAMPLESRLDRLVTEYAGFSADELIHSFQKISKRLGGLRTAQAIEHLHANRFREAAEIALQYYDKSYAYTLDQRAGHLISLEVAGDYPAETAQLLRNLIQQHTFTNSNHENR